MGFLIVYTFLTFYVLRDPTIILKPIKNDIARALKLPDGFYSVLSHQQSVRTLAEKLFKSKTAMKIKNLIILRYLD